MRELRREIAIGAGVGAFPAMTTYLQIRRRSAVCGDAMERRLAAHNPFTRLRLPEAAKGPKRNLSPADVHALIDGATDLMRPFVATVAFTGARVSEVLGLVWADIDLDAGIIDISGQLQRGERTRTKTEAGAGGVGIPSVSSRSSIRIGASRWSGACP